HLFHRRTDECCQTFPLWLPNDPQPPTKIARSAHYRILGKGIADLRQWMIKREVTRNTLRKTRRLKAVEFQAPIAGAQDFSTLLDIDCAIPNRSHKSVADVFPMKHLT